jgi:hypothetical protein
MYYVLFVQFNLPWFIQSIAITGGLWVISRMLWMCVYQWKYGGNAGEEYFLHGKEGIKEKYK